MGSVAERIPEEKTMEGDHSIYFEYSPGPARTYYLGTGALKRPLRPYYLGTWGARVGY